ncbi:MULTISPECIES: LuxR C-terminal-related transcriptional regulator [Pseudomonas]|uniref:LuxR C-terminal-related transcriptional regulator n=1 Tax=Pseudomonas TaxID=286 RepID=UPI0023D87D42|nr:MULTISPECIES: LuxR C-terminal-related transcriptional regulator [unclassified Pseudomonas]MED5612043.1 LuxR C-terminal-related transcriptional regulator [Pseudomonas sp. JH-2]
MNTLADGRFAPIVDISDSLTRQRLLDALLGAAPSDARLVLVCAPAGFGKTTLLAQAERLLAGRGERTFWVNCSDSDYQPELFLDSLLQGLREGIAEPAGDNGLGALLGLLEACPLNCNLFLDQVELALSPEVERLLEQLARRLPSGCRLLLGSRRQPLLPITQLQLAGLLRVVEADSLRFTGEESQQLLGALLGEARARYWADYTEGWPFALQLLRLRCQGSPAGEGPPETDQYASLGGIFDYLAEEVLASWPSELGEFLLDCSVLDSVDVPSANFLRGRDDAERWLREAARLVPIVVPEQPLRVRLHPLLREFLLGRLESREPERFAWLQGRAAEFHARRQQVFRAVEHAAQGGLYFQAVSIILGAGAVRLLVCEGAVRTRALLELLPLTLVRREPRLRLMLICLHMLSGETLQDSLDLSRLEAAFGGEVASPEDAETRTDLLYVRAMMVIGNVQRAGDGAVREVVRRAMVDARARFFEDPRYLCLVLPSEIMLLLRYGNVDEARLRLEEFIAINRSEGFRENQPWSLVYRALSDSAQARYDDVLQTVTGLLAKDGPLAAPQASLLFHMVHALLGHVHYVRGDLEQARQAFSHCASRLGASLAEVWERGLIGAARAAFFLGDSAQALASLEAARSGHTLEYPLRRAVGATLVELRLRQREVEAGLALAMEINLARLWQEVLDGRPLFWAELVAIAQAHYWLLAAQGQMAGALEAAEAFERLARERQNRFGVGQALVLKAHALLAGELPGTPMAVLDEALELFGEGLAVQSFIEAGAEVVTHLREMSRRQGRAEVPLITRCIELWERHFRARLDAQALFTRRELDALMGLAGGRTTKVIARELGISPETVKQHLKSVYAKLGVHRRREALAVARRRAILP